MLQCLDIKHLQEPRWDTLGYLWRLRLKAMISKRTTEQFKPTKFTEQIFCSSSAKAADSA
jgi:AMMECR1 domain-containing protein